MSMQLIQMYGSGDALENPTCSCSLDEIWFPFLIWQVNGKLIQTVKITQVLVSIGQVVCILCIPKHFHLNYHKEFINSQGNQSHSYNPNINIHWKSSILQSKMDIMVNGVHILQIQCDCKQRMALNVGHFLHAHDTIL